MDEVLRRWKDEDNRRKIQSLEEENRRLKVDLQERERLFEQAKNSSAHWSKRFCEFEPEYYKAIAERDEAISRASESRNALDRLVEQLAFDDFVDALGHKATMLSAYVNARELLGTTS